MVDLSIVFCKRLPEGIFGYTIPYDNCCGSINLTPEMWSPHPMFACATLFLPTYPSVCLAVLSACLIMFVYIYSKIISYMIYIYYPYFLLLPNCDHSHFTNSRYFFLGLFVRRPWSTSSRSVLTSSAWRNTRRLRHRVPDAMQPSRCKDSTSHAGIKSYTLC